MNKFKILTLLIIILVIVFSLWWVHGSSPVNSQDKTGQVFVVKPREALREIANQLEQKKLIADPTVFFLIVKQSGLDSKIQAGDFRLSPNMTPLQIAQSMTKGALDVWITIPEGKRATEVSAIFKDKFPQYSADWEQKMITEEGFLFPDTYLFAKNTTIEQIITTMKNNFTQKFDSVPTNPDNLYTKKQIVTVASMVEREAKYAEDRPLVASIIYNRLKIDMPLQFDSTVEYALGYQADEHTWWKNDMTVDDLAIKTPYNTRVYPGLPPTPICNPGLSSLAAAINPAQTNYYYFFTDANGKNHYATTLDQHNANIKKYE